MIILRARLAVWCGLRGPRPDGDRNHERHAGRGRTLNGFLIEPAPAHIVVSNRSANPPIQEISRCFAECFVSRRSRCCSCRCRRGPTSSRTPCAPTAWCCSRRSKVNIWGTAAQGEKVAITFREHSASHRRRRRRQVAGQPRLRHRRRPLPHDHPAATTPSTTRTSTSAKSGSAPANRTCNGRSSSATAATSRPPSRPRPTRSCASSTSHASRRQAGGRRARTWP